MSSHSSMLSPVKLATSNACSTSILIIVIAGDWYLSFSINLTFKSYSILFSVLQHDYAAYQTGYHHAIFQKKVTNPKSKDSRLESAQKLT